MNCGLENILNSEVNFKCKNQFGNLLAGNISGTFSASQLKFSSSIKCPLVSRFLKICSEYLANLSNGDSGIKSYVVIIVAKRN